MSIGPTIDTMFGLGPPRRTAWEDKCRYVFSKECRYNFGKEPASATTPKEPLFDIERVYRIWDNSTGGYLEIAGDDDFLELVAIQEYDKDRALVNTLTLHPEQAEKLGAVLLQVAATFKK